MDAATFWEIIDDARDGTSSPQALCARLTEDLAHEEPTTIVAFERFAARLMERSYTRELWGAAHLINGGCSDDGFDSFRCWLITQGRAVFERAVLAPDSLADHAEEPVGSDDFLYVAASAYRELTGEYPEGAVIVLPELERGWDFDNADEMMRRYPRLWARFG